MTEDAPGAPPEFVTVTPGTLPCIAFGKFCWFPPNRTSFFKLATAPTNDFFDFFIPKAVTITSSSSTPLFNMTSRILWPITNTSFVSNPI
jgi:hypothetical protein